MKPGAIIFITQMSVKDAFNILNGADNAATLQRVFGSLDNKTTN
ncbi:MAG TPA: hypothetical protein VFB97_04935 [Bacteroidales bacterium]|nr:hypothetical protein [Bacteroidales bacterium]